MPPLSAALAVLAALVSAADPKPPPKQSWGETVKPMASAMFCPQRARIEIDGKPAGTGFVEVTLPPGRASFRIRVSADGFETEEREVPAARVADKDFRIALRPAGFAEKVEPDDAPSMAKAAAALWHAKRADDAIEYAELSLRAGNTPLANRILGEVWRSRGDRDRATRYYTMYLSIMNRDTPETADIRAYLLEGRPGDISVPAAPGR